MSGFDHALFGLLQIQVPPPAQINKKKIFPSATHNTPLQDLCQGPLLLKVAWGFPSFSFKCIWNRPKAFSSANYHRSYCWSTKGGWRLPWGDLLASELLELWSSQMIEPSQQNPSLDHAHNDLKGLTDIFCKSIPDISTMSFHSSDKNEFQPDYIPCKNVKGNVFKNPKPVFARGRWDCGSLQLLLIYLHGLTFSKLNYWTISHFFWTK